MKLFPACRLLLALALLGGAGSLSACASFIPDPYTVVDQPLPLAEETIYAHVVGFAPGSDHLDLKERFRLDRFLGNAGLATTDMIRVGAADGSALSARREAVVVAYLRHRTGAADEVAPNRTGNVATNSVEVELRRYLVRLPCCPDWTDRPGRTFSNKPSANWGCASAINLGRMVVEPRDLAFGREPVPTDGTYLAGAITRFQTGTIRPLDGNQSAEPIIQPAAGGEGGAP